MLAFSYYNNAWNIPVYSERGSTLASSVGASNQADPWLPGFQGESGRQWQGVWNAAAYFMISRQRVRRGLGFYNTPVEWSPRDLRIAP